MCFDALGLVLMFGGFWFAEFDLITFVVFFVFYVLRLRLRLGYVF